MLSILTVMNKMSLLKQRKSSFCKYSLRVNKRFLMMKYLKAKVIPSQKKKTYLMSCFDNWSMK